MAPRKPRKTNRILNPRCVCLRWGGVVVSLVMVCSSSQAAVHRPPQTVDELELARWVADVGDRATLGFLSAEHTSAQRFIAVRAVSSLHDPERALVPLAALAGGRDPDLAPAAAEVAVRISQMLTADDLTRREVLPADLEPALAAFDKLQQRKDLRPDIALQAAQVVVQLQVFVAEPESKDEEK